jgi:hypothetical protein
MLLCNLVDSYRHFEVRRNVHFLASHRHVYKQELECGHHIAQDNIAGSHDHENLKSHAIPHGPMDLYLHYCSEHGAKCNVADICTASMFVM